jgi:hypothetical protein
MEATCALTRWSSSSSAGADPPGQDYPVAQDRSGDGPRLITLRASAHWAHPTTGALLQQRGQTTAEGVVPPARRGGLLKVVQDRFTKTRQSS